MAKPGCESIQETQSASCTRNVIEYVNCYETRNHLWVIFEYCAGGDLLRLLKQDGRLPEERVARREHWVAVCLCVFCEGVVGGIIFCDLKPGNILFNEDEVLKLGHFAQALRVEEAFPNRTGQPLRRGAPQYMAPELFSEAGVHSFVSDLWSLGCVLHELFSGAQPFISPSSQQLQRLVVDTAPPKMPGATPEFQEHIRD
ncbi:unnamed protein product [Durusdinium trenchii]|uniref:Protein kinase domain-containing protein n=1 Tax=Durusdinium trenchii TaxID=1381693 RepID=A0ABP0QVY7_9DINO